MMNVIKNIWCHVVSNIDTTVARLQHKGL